MGKKMKMFATSWYKPEQFLEDIPLRIVSDGKEYNCVAVCTSQAAFGEGYVSGVTAIKYPEELRLAESVQHIGDIESLLDQIVYAIVEIELDEDDFLEYKASFKLERQHKAINS